jgi:hypothetical protein
MTTLSVFLKSQHVLETREHMQKFFTSFTGLLTEESFALADEIADSIDSLHAKGAHSDVERIVSFIVSS